MYEDGENIFYYLTVMNENYAHAADARRRSRWHSEGDVPLPRGQLANRQTNATARAQLFGSGAILNEVTRAQEILAEKYGVAADVWSVTSYKALYETASTRALEHVASGEKPRVPYVRSACGCARRARRGFGLREDAAEHDRASGCRGR